MKKARRFFALMPCIFLMALLVRLPTLLYSQTANTEQAKEEALRASEQAKTEGQARAEQQKTEAAKAREVDYSTKYEPVLKTYSLKYISADEFVRAAKLYIMDSSGSEAALTVRVARMNIPALEDLLKKLDVEKRNIQFQVYTIIASKDEEPPGPYKDAIKNETKEITNKDLKRVLDEIKGLWNFKHYWLDSPSFLMVKDGSTSNSFRLVSSRHLNMFIRRVQVRGDEPGKRTIAVGQITLTEELNTAVSTLIDTSDINFKEKGYLVVGVSGFTSGWAGMALILVINAEIK